MNFTNLIRQFAEEQLQTDPEAAKEAEQGHRDYFVAFLEARTAGMKERRQKETLIEIKADMDNVRLAWRRAVANRDAKAIERSAECLFVYYLYGNGYDEGQIEFGQAVRALAKAAATPAGDDQPQALISSDHQGTLVGFLLAGQAIFLPTGMIYRQANSCWNKRSLSYGAHNCPTRAKEAFALLWLGWAVYFQGRNAECWPHAREM